MSKKQWFVIAVITAIGNMASKEYERYEILKVSQEGGDPEVHKRIAGVYGAVALIGMLILLKKGIPTSPRQMWLEKRIMKKVDERLAEHGIGFPTAATSEESTGG